ncbi:unnamed protein product, partial [Urochloa humidicola]
SRERAERGERGVRGATGVAGTTHHRDDSLRAAASESREGEGAGIRRRRAPAAGAARGFSGAELLLWPRRGDPAPWSVLPFGRVAARGSSCGRPYARRAEAAGAPPDSVGGGFATGCWRIFTPVNVCPCPRCLAHYQGPFHSHPLGSAGVSGAANGALSRTPEVPISQPLAASPPWLGHEMRSQGVPLAAACAHQRGTRYCTGCLIASTAAAYIPS